MLQSLLRRVSFRSGITSSPSSLRQLHLLGSITLSPPLFVGIGGQGLTLHSNNLKLLSPSSSLFSLSFSTEVSTTSKYIKAEMLKLAATKVLKGLLQLIDKHTDDFNSRDWATCFNLLKGLNRNDIQKIKGDPIFQTFIIKTADKIGVNDKTNFFLPIGQGMIASSVSK